jgi:hypothetical protein
MWNAMRGMADGQSIVHPRTANALIERGFAKHVRKTGLYKLTKAGKAQYNKRHSRSQP